MRSRSTRVGSPVDRRNAAIAALLGWCGLVGATRGAGPPPAVDTSAAPARAPTGEFPANELLSTIRERSVHRRQVDWSKAGPAFLDRVARATTDEERARAVVQLFAELDDVHSILQFDGRSHGHYEGVDEEVRRKVMPLLERSRAQTNKVMAKLLEGGCGYVRVPSMAANTPEEVERLARELRSAIAEVAAGKPTAWIVDLRLDGGGNVYPMLVGLAPLLGDGVVGGTVDGDGRLVHEWVLKPDGLYWRDGAGDRRFAALDLPVQLVEPTPPVAVLVGPVTGSSGEATALAFKGRPRCALLGEPTAKGYTTVINPFPIDARTTLSLAVGFMADRGGAPCKSQVAPDEVIEGGDAFDDLATDRKVLAAMKWLRGQAAASAKPPPPPKAR